MALDDERAAGSESRSRVPTRHGEGEREVGGREVDGHADRHEHPPHVGAWSEHEVGVCLVEANVEVRAVADDIREETDLHGRSLQLAREASLGEARLAHADRDELPRGLVERVSDRDERRGAFGRGRRRPDGRGDGCRRENLLELGVAGERGGCAHR